MSEEPITVLVGGNSFSDLDEAVDWIVKELDASPNRVARKVSDAMRRSLQRVAGALEDAHSTPWNGDVVNPRDTLQRRSGEGLKSIRDSIHVTGSGGSVENVKGSISTGTMTIHETGGTITAKSGKYLTIPLPAACDSRGVPLRRSARDWDRTFVQRSRRGNLIIFQRQGRKLVPLYLLKPSVYIRPRLGLERAYMNEMPYFQERLLDLFVKELKL
ncbi:hypothetical protein J2J97_31775 (plasmid) [Rhizobium bangladeshense]|uniref:hypothetical protein n=1 Tax=Rhizobium bangladeshense TaxID=1138189 RepID=UPI001A996130|nr:hypothetical protein [Rhizobium bangladeshense]QSY98651.1 hypothetical protein J2J97_31775 [Rhizobium bangladeshense]